VAHTVLFPEVYLQEFADLFDQERPPRAPTVYLCAQQIAHDRPGWPEHEPVFVMANAPAEPLNGSDPTQWEILHEEVVRRVVGAGLIDADDSVVWERSPSGLARRFPGSRGALYGSSSNDLLAAFRRPPNKLRGVPGVYLASGSAHPGGGMPLCALSGRAAAQAIAWDLGVSGQG